jgi:hypothetical protein
MPGLGLSGVRRYCVAWVVVVLYDLVVQRSCFVCGSWSVFQPVVLLGRCFFNLLGALKLALVDCAFYGARIPNATFMPGLCCSYACFCGLHYVVLLWIALWTSFACLYDTSMLDSMI